MFDSGYQQKYVVSTFTGMSPDTSEWPVDGTIYAQMPTTNPTLYLRTPSPTTARPASKPTWAAGLSPPTTPPPTSQQRRQRRRPTQKPTNLPTYWPTFSPTWITTPPSSSPTKSPSRSPSAWPRTRKPTARPIMQNPTCEFFFDRSLTATHIAACAIGNATTTTIPTPTTTPTDTPVTTHTPRGGHGLW
jgi:hypothetical protein